MVDRDDDRPWLGWLVVLVATLLLFAVTAVGLGWGIVSYRP